MWLIIGYLKESDGRGGRPDRRKLCSCTLRTAPSRSGGSRGTDLSIHLSQTEMATQCDKQMGQREAIQRGGNQKDQVAKNWQNGAELGLREGEGLPKWPCTLSLYPAGFPVS